MLKSRYNFFVNQLGSAQSVYYEILSINSKGSKNASQHVDYQFGELILVTLILSFRFVYARIIKGDFALFGFERGGGFTLRWLDRSG